MAGGFRIRPMKGEDEGNVLRGGGDDRGGGDRGGG